MAQLDQRPEPASDPRPRLGVVWVIQFKWCQAFATVRKMRPIPLRPFFLPSTSNNDQLPSV